MALLACLGCSTRFAVGLSRCPHCQSEDFEEDNGMSPKITVHGGPSIAGASVVGGAWTDADAPDSWPNLDAEESEEPSADVASEPGYEEWTVEQLKDELVSRGLPKSGKQADLVQRLRDHDAAAQGSE